MLEDGVAVPDRSRPARVRLSDHERSAKRRLKAGSSTIPDHWRRRLFDLQRQARRLVVRGMCSAFGQGTGWTTRSIMSPEIEASVNSMDR